MPPCAGNAGWRTCSKAVEAELAQLADDGKSEQQIVTAHIAALVRWGASGSPITVFQRPAGVPYVIGSAGLLFVGWLRSDTAGTGSGDMPRWPPALQTRAGTRLDDELRS